MNKSKFQAISMTMAAVFGFSFGCSETGFDSPSDTVERPVPAARSVSVEVQIEGALRDIERGENLEEARATLESSLNVPSVTSDQRDDARLGLSRVYELEGNKEQAIGMVEQLLSSHGVGEQFPASAWAQRRLRLLLTGSEGSARSPRPTPTVPPIATVLAGYFHRDADGFTNVELLVYGVPPEENKRLGTFNISDGLDALQEEECPLCTEEIRVNQHTSRSTWGMLPRAAAASPGDSAYATALNVFYYDPEIHRIPSRYDTYLPIPTAEIDSVLKEGDGLVAVKTRDGAPPVVLIAAPRWSMLTDVEKAFASMKKLPSEPKRVSVSHKLRPGEIERVVRSEYPKLRKCYESTLRTRPSAQGIIQVDFAIEADGSIADITTEDESTLREPALQACFRDVFSTMRFPASSGRMTVKYPIALRPDTQP